MHTHTRRACEQLRRQTAPAARDESNSGSAKSLYHVAAAGHGDVLLGGVQHLTHRRIGHGEPRLGGGARAAITTTAKHKTSGAQKPIRRDPAKLMHTGIAMDWWGAIPVLRSRKE
uniref:Uncharacterized protein n=1 Tax=Physcomitrium patens TaxID=3218 RepID=A0A2K1J3V4_PHYPA|nr:hypothetical protein PHYPA_022057 [Physcomitrium patens]